MRVFHVGTERFAELQGLPDTLPAAGFVWVGVTRSEFGALLAEIQAALQRWTGNQLVDLHVSDLLNEHLPSHYDYTSWYDVLVFRRLVAGVEALTGELAAAQNGRSEHAVTAASARETLSSIDTSPVGFALFDRVLVSVHPGDCSVRDFFAQRLAALTQGADARGMARLPPGPADLMLRMVNHIVDGYLDLRRLLTRQLTALQTQLLAPRSRFVDWHVLLDARNTLYMLEDTGEDQRSAVQEWIEALDQWPAGTEPQQLRDRELLRVRSRDVLEHIERVLTHVRRLAHSAESAVQMHFSALGNRTNDIMRTLTVLTAIFLPLNLITGFFGMNFDSLPLVHSSDGLWAAFWLMVAIALGLGWWFRRKRYLGGGR